MDYSPFTNERFHVYVAGPYTADTTEDVEANVNVAMRFGIALIQLGHVPFIPHLTHFLDKLNEDGAYGVRLGYEDYMAYDQRWLERCDALLLINHSPGADRELKRAKEIGLHIFKDLGKVPRFDEVGARMNFIRGRAPTPDLINHPPHYGGDTTYEAIKVIQAWRLNFALGCVAKYLSRAGKKAGAAELEDIKKARRYLDFHIAELENKL